ncbi:unnamed protein product [Amoebophrya sp. A120]|nr:unnamed protein product [Amoebophrya sp. A120]|eukprot:GSA120T00009957001.1
MSPLMSRRTYIAATVAAILSPHNTASGERRKTTPKAASEKPEQQDPYAFLEEHHEADEQAMAYEQAMAARFGVAMANSGEAPGRRSGMGSSRGRRKRRRGGGYGHGHHHGWNKKRNKNRHHSHSGSSSRSSRGRGASAAEGLGEQDDGAEGANIFLTLDKQNKNP